MLTKSSTKPKKNIIEIMITLEKIIKKINHEFHFLTNLILNESEIKKTIRKIKGTKTIYIKKHNMFDG
jgi:hypothetical protein